MIKYSSNYVENSSGGMMLLNIIQETKTFREENAGDQFVKNKQRKAKIYRNDQQQLAYLLRINRGDLPLPFSHGL